MREKFLDKAAIRILFDQIDERLDRESNITLLGATSLILLDIIDRGTMDIDIANSHDALSFKKIAAKLHCPVDIVTVSSTVDFANADLRVVYQGKRLKVSSVSEKELIKLKLERYRKQDPGDISAIIKKIGLSFEDYKTLALEASQDYVGNPKMFILSILMVAEDHYSPKQAEELNAILAKE
jgi:hypothetical protein